MAEDFAFHQGSGNGGTVDDDERVGASWAEIMDGPCNQFFSRSAFPLYKDCAIALRDVRYQIEDLPHGLVLADHFFKGMIPFQFASKIGDLPHKIPFFQGSADHGQHIIHCEGFDDVFIRPQFNGLHGSLDLLDSGDHNNLGIGVQ